MHTPNTGVGRTGINEKPWILKIHDLRGIIVLVLPPILQA
jgi:hypothetical protein